ncbi:MAG: ATP-binding protein [Bacillota bacterium]
MGQTEYIKKLIDIFDTVSLYEGVINSGPSATMAELLQAVSCTGDNAAPKKLLAKLFKELAARAEFSHFPQAGNLWQSYLLDQIILNENTFTRMAAGGRLHQGGPPAGTVMSTAASDLKSLKILLDVDFRRLFPFDRDDCAYPELINTAPEIAVPEAAKKEASLQYYRLKLELLYAEDWGETAKTLLEFHSSSGYGTFCLCHAFRWDGKNKRLAAIADPDPVRMEDLVGYEDERNRVILNTDRLLSGLPASNLLLYGDRGTGKSSTVKALLHQYGHRGLRIVEIPKKHLEDYPEIIESIKDTGLKFILFVDDLSFEDHETEYKQLKSILDGSLQAKPGNTAIYATSNRRHLVREFFDERNKDVNGMDTVQEKLSLSDRFGLTVLFLSPDQELYLKIVEGLAAQKGIAMPLKELRLRAIEWERWNNGRSGRTARQFVDHLIAPYLK